jgi:hypothetical protein
MTQLPIGVRGGVYIAGIPLVMVVLFNAGFGAIPLVVVGLALAAGAVGYERRLAVERTDAMLAGLREGDVEPRRGGEAGIPAFTTTQHFCGGLGETRTLVVERLVSALSQAGFRINAQSERRIELSKVSRSTAVWILTVILFPLGLLIFLTVKREENIAVLLHDSDAGTDVTVSGQARRPSRWVVKAIFERGFAPS